MQEIKGVGPNIKTYYYYTNEMANAEKVKGSIIIATGIEATGSIYDEIGDYLDSKGYAMYAIDEWGYGKTGKVTKQTYKNWRRGQSYFAAYNIHSLAVTAKKEHPEAPVYLLGNDFGAMLSQILVKEFPEAVDKVIYVGWGMPRAQDYGFLLTAYIRKLFFYDAAVAKLAHFSKNKRLALRFETKDKYAWLTSDKEQLKKIEDAGYIDDAGTVGHYFYYYARKFRTPNFMSLRKCNKSTPMLLLSGENDLTTLHGRKTKALAKFYRRKKFTDVSCVIVPGRHELLFETNRFEVMDLILDWLETGETPNSKIVENNLPSVDTEETYDVEVLGTDKAPEGTNEGIKVEEAIDVEEVTAPTYNEFEEAEDDLRIDTNKK